MKAAARGIVELEIPEYAKGSEEIWTHESVKEALVYAYISCELSAGFVGPKGARSGWPEYMREFQDLTGRDGMKPEAKRFYRRLSLVDLDRMETVIEGRVLTDGRKLRPWLNDTSDLYVEQYVGKLKAWVANEVAKALGRRHQPISQICKRLSCSKATFDRHVTRAAGIIADRLNRAEVPVW